MKTTWIPCPKDSSIPRDFNFEVYETIAYIKRRIEYGDTEFTIQELCDYISYDRKVVSAALNKLVIKKVLYFDNYVWRVIDGQS